MKEIIMNKPFDDDNNYLQIDNKLINGRYDIIKLEHTSTFSTYKHIYVFLHINVDVILKNISNEI